MKHYTHNVYKNNMRKSIRKTITKSDSKYAPKSYVYLIREREHIRMNEEIYKLGKTTQEPNSRLAGYPKNSEVVLYMDVPNCHTTEKNLMNEFDERFISRRDIGREYYEGDLNHMKRTFMDVASSEFQGNYTPINQGWLKWLWNHIKRLCGG